ncbi:MAG: transcription antitermination factor NusB [Phycisphaerae bacterium]|nr:transcription antitermination factor NusB [Phycisphaerae bacterium]
MDRRTKARELTMQALCQLDVQGDDASSMLRIFFRDNTDDDLVLELAEQWTQGTWSKVRACDDLISAAAVRWKLSRLSHVDRAILRMSVYQLSYCKDIPCKVVINEAIEIAKKYSTEQSPRFVNGVLDAVLKNLEQKTSVQQSSTEESVP